MSNKETKNKNKKGMNETQNNKNIQEEQQMENTNEASEGEEPKEEANEANEWKERYLRLAAEYDNYRKRVKREIARAKQEGKEKVWLEIFPIIDDIYRAISASEQSDNIEKIKEGLKLIKEKIEKLFAKNEIEPIPDKGHEFDSTLHEAIAWIETPNEEQEGKIIDVVEKGYKKGEKVLKHSKVVVGKSKND